MWARKGVVATRCPKSLITAASRGWIEEYLAWKVLGGADYRTMSARQVDAFLVLEEAWRAERNNRDE